MRTANVSRFKLIQGFAYREFGESEIGDAEQPHNDGQGENDDVQEHGDAWEKGDA